ncbi:MAG: sugar phosphate isomerase/epimerase, partial [Clostridiaceae bacterium]|nr:sugar phosphate isomerase/epimerase [Clostridiaceae bacterium]
IGVVPEQGNHPRYEIMQKACRELCEFADNMASHFAIETGPETAATLKKFLDSLGGRGVAVNLDPANLVMVTGDDPVKAVYTLKDYIVHTHAKDGKMLHKKSAEVIYGLEEDKMLNDPAFIEVPLGTGQVDFPNYLKALDEIGYKGYLTIEREVGDNPKADIELAVNFLKNIIG